MVVIASVVLRTVYLLLHLAETVDVVEPISKLTEALAKGEGVGSISNLSLEEWRTDEAGDVSYDVIWNQWCLEYPTFILPPAFSPPPRARFHVREHLHNAV
ncbi:hypothetical protein F5B21DRAFT_452674 [Xylaria acuta]|nr:hypothetical protein F5B21DRAFT_452674 [Xylaria acuta]